MAMPRKCSEPGCNNFLKSPQAKTCSDSCRQKRARRMKRQKMAGPRAAGEKTRVPQEWKDVLEDVGHEVAKEELRPVVREAMTEDSMQALQRMVGLLPGVVAQLEKDIAHPDEVVRQKAHAMVLRYTLGHEKALPPDDKQGSQLTVNLTMPRPGQEQPTIEVAPEQVEDADEVRTCDTCQQSRPLTDFFGAALRCSECVDAFQARANALLEPSPAAGEESA